jgi:hypothetical protein
MTLPLSTSITDCLKWYDAIGANAVRYDGKWVWRSDIKKDPELARQLLLSAEIHGPEAAFDGEGNGITAL